MSDVSENGRPNESEEPCGEGLDPLQARFVEIIGAGGTMGGAASELRRSERTLRRWKTDPAVKAAIRERVTENLARARAILSAGAAEAASALVDIAKGTQADASRVSAAKGVLDGAAKFGELAELEERLAAIEAQLASPPGPARRGLA